MADSLTSSTVQSGESAAIVRKGVAIAGIQVSVKKSEAHTYTCLLYTSPVWPARRTHPAARLLRHHVLRPVRQGLPAGVVRRLTVGHQQRIPATSRCV